MLAQPIITPHDGSDRIWRLVEDYQIASLGVRVDIKAGFLFDGLSIPRVFWRVVGHPLAGRALPGGLTHDALYASHLVDRDLADDIFLDVLTRNSVKWHNRRIMYLAVHLFGGVAWLHNSRDIKSAREYVQVRKET
jgi:hypothetical protein